MGYVLQPGDCRTAWDSRTGTLLSQPGIGNSGCDPVSIRATPPPQTCRFCGPRVPASYAPTLLRVCLPCVTPVCLTIHGTHRDHELRAAGEAVLYLLCAHLTAVKPPDQRTLLRTRVTADGKWNIAGSNEHGLKSRAEAPAFPSLYFHHDDGDDNE